MTRRAISPPPGSVQVPRVASLKAPADLTPTVAPAGKRHPVADAGARRQELEVARRALVDHAAALRGALAAMDCDPLELTSVLAAIDHILDEEVQR
jgi:hypothetical protein